MARTIYFLSLFLMMPLFCTATLTDDGGDITLSFTLSSFQVVEKNGPAQPVLRLSRPVDCCSTISVWVYVEDMEAKQGSDYTSESHMQVLFPGGITTTKFDVRMVDTMVVGRKILENKERFKVSIDPLSLPFGVVLGDITSAEVSILDQDETQVSFEESTYAVNEGEGILELTLKLTEPIPFINDTLQLVIGEDATATTCDYGSVHTVPIPTDTTMFTYNVVINDDDLYELDETFTLQIVASSLHPQIKRAQPYTTTVTIFNDEEPIRVTLTTQPTIDEGAGVLKVTLSLDKPSPCCLRVYVETRDIMAEGEEVDYGTGGDNRLYEVIFPAGTNCSSVEIPINNDGVSEQDEEFTVKIMGESLPFGITLGDNTITDVTIIDNDIYLMFSSSEYEGYEHDGMLCVTVTHDKPALFDTHVQITEMRGTATDGRDYEEGPYNVIIPKGNTSTDYCINITNDEDLELDEAFRIIINETAVAQGVVVMNPNEARVIIKDDEYTFCFDLPSYAVDEDDGFLLMNLTLSRALPFDISVKFVYENISATGNHSIGTTSLVDYYTAKVFPNFDTILAGERRYTLNVTIEPDLRLENNELFRVTARPHRMPAGQPECKVDVIIKDDDDIIVEFENDSYAVMKNTEVIPAIVVTYPLNYTIKMFPIVIRVDEIDSTTTKGVDYEVMNYTAIIENGGTDRLEIRTLRAIDDNIVEADETFNLAIVIVSAHRRVSTGVKMNTTKITIYNDDVAFLSFVGKSLVSSKRMEFPVDTTATVDITYVDGQHNITTITREQALKDEPIPLPIFEVDVAEIDVHYPCKFESKTPNGFNVQPGMDEDLIEVHYDNDCE